MSPIKITFVFILLSGLSVQSLFAQKGEKIKYQADVLKGIKKDTVSYVKMNGHVKFEQPGTVIHCDSAILYRSTNSLDAFGHVKILDMRDSVTITANKLFYQGDNRMANLRGHVIYTDDSIRLFTENLDYDMTNKSATYFGGGQIIDNVNTLTSEEGLYDTEAKVMIFQRDVVLVNPEYTMETQELIYHILTKTARTTGTTYITTSDGRQLVAQEGSNFDTRNKTSVFLLGEIDTDSYYLKADRMVHDQALAIYTASGNVRITGKKDNVTIHGDHAWFAEHSGRSKIYGHAYLEKPMEEDTLFIRADTLFSIDSKIKSEKRLLAYHHVLLYKNDLQGKADSLSYHVADSTIFFYGEPILWSKGSQITADSINITIVNGSIERLNAISRAFIISSDSLDDYNQVKGRTLTAFFKNSKLDHVDVNGNGESIYFVFDEKNPELMVGMNKIMCSNMKIDFDENTVHKISFYTSPEGSFIPPHELKDKDKTLEGFKWHIKFKPVRDDVIHYDPAKARGLEETTRETEKKEEIVIKKRKRKIRSKPPAH